MTIVHAASAPRFVARLATHARDTEEERKAIVFNHPRGEICLENHLGVIDDSGVPSLHLSPAPPTPPFMNTYCGMR